MTRSRTDSVLARRFDRDGNGRRPEHLIVEEPLAIRLDDVQVSSTMRTPGHDFELAVGFLHTEGALAGAPVQGIRYCGTGAATESDFNVVTVETGGRAPAPTPRLGSTSSSCGLCGVEAITELTERLRVLAPHEPWDTDLLLGLPALLRSTQPLFDATGGVHGAAAVDRTGRLVVVREDIGRHNAVDKVVGRLLLDDRLPAEDLALVVSGRGSFEMVQKAWAAGFTALVAVSAPSALAVATARRAGITFVGFARDGAGNLYSPTDAV
ncbi:MAG: formate dehydrogenase accessory sulfurtransferase FdhD [Acidimicrobiales bacterium]